MEPFNQLLARINRTGISRSELGLDAQLDLLEHSFRIGLPDRDQYEIIMSTIEELENQRLMSPFLEPLPNAGLSGGDVHIVTTPGGMPVCISFGKGRPNEVTHMCVSGQTGSGKSCQMGVIAYNAAPHCRTFIIDVNRFYRSIGAMHRHHTFLRWNHVRLNPWDGPPNVSPKVFDAMANHEVCDCFGLKFAEYEISEVVSELREEGTPNMVDVVSKLKGKKYGGFSKRGQYRDSGVLVLGTLLSSSGDLFRCKVGMNVRDLLCSGNIVLETDGLLPQIQSFLLRYFFEYVHGLALAEDSR